MYDKYYFCLDQLPKLKKESTASFFVIFGRSRGTKELLMSFAARRAATTTFLPSLAIRLLKKPRNLSKRLAFRLTTCGANTSCSR